MHRLILSTLAVLMLVGSAFAADDGGAATTPKADAPVAAEPKADAPKADPNAYPLDYCATCGPEDKEALITKTHKGREIKLCKGCVKMFTADPDGYVKKVDKVIKEAEKAKADKAAEKKADGKGHEGHDHGDHKH